MNNRDMIIDKTIELIESNPDGLKHLTIREIAKECNVAVGLVNYHFSSKDALIAESVSKIVNGIIDRFGELKDEIEGLTPIDKLHKLGCITLDYLFEHYQISRISILNDMSNPNLLDNYSRTVGAYIPLVKAIKKDLSDKEVKAISFTLVTTMQQSFIRHDTIKILLDLDLTVKEDRYKYHRMMIKQILGE